MRWLINQTELWSRLSEAIERESSTSEGIRSGLERMARMAEIVSHLIIFWWWYSNESTYNFIPSLEVMEKGKKELGSVRRRRRIAYLAQINGHCRNSMSWTNAMMWKVLNSGMKNVGSLLESLSLRRWFHKFFRFHSFSIARRVVGLIRAHSLSPFPPNISLAPVQERRRFIFIVSPDLCMKNCGRIAGNVNWENVA